MRICVDIDGTLCTQRDGDYGNAAPDLDLIDWVNERHLEGHEITIHTARGTETGIDWEAETVAQLARWGVRYDRLIFGKPAADLYVDDRAVRPDEL